MTLIGTLYAHVVLDEQGIPWIENTQVKVVEIVLDKLAYGWSPEEIQYQHPHLSLGQVYSALAYYADHYEEIEQDIERRSQLVEELRRKNKPSPLVERIRQHRAIGWR